MNTNKEQRANRLIHEKSPYLLQHAYNPVDWYPWGDEAFEKARIENKPILVSIGYSTCHWCHVMERESFSIPETAEVMNSNLVCIKVDREERPDIDEIYMTAVSAMIGSGGWPLNVFLTPELKPFYGGTYFPPEQRWGQPGWKEVVTSIGTSWNNPDGRKKIISSATELTGQLRQHFSQPGGDKAPGFSALDRGFDEFQADYETQYGGFARSPKFPMPVIHNFLLRYHRFASRNGREEKAEKAKKAEKAVEMSLNTLRFMAGGGIYDHIGGGFHRYSTDERWHVPHFEKMLYDNAQLIVSYCEAYQVSGDDFFADTARQTIDYVLRDMMYGSGGFYSAEDADSLPQESAGKSGSNGHAHKVEGAFYVWTDNEIRQHLSDEAAELFIYRYGIGKNGNAQSDPHGEFKGKNILYAAHTITETAKKFKKSRKEITSVLDTARQTLFKTLALRHRPHLDDKILTSWNGLMISACARAYQVLGDDTYKDAGIQTAAFLRENLYDPRKRLLYRRWRKGERSVNGLADDYAFLARGLLDLYEATFDIQWLEWSMELADELVKHFYDTGQGGFFTTADGHDSNLIIRVKSDYDNVEPSASSVAVSVLHRLAQFTDNRHFRDYADTTLRYYYTRMEAQPRVFPQMLVALSDVMTKPYQIIIAGDEHEPDTRAIIEKVYSRYLPNKVIIVLNNASRKLLTPLLPFTESMTPLDGKATAYVCIDYACRLPSADPDEVGKMLGE